MRVECDRFERWASLFRDHRLPGRARTAVERHLSFCQACAARYQAYTAALDGARMEPASSSLIPADVTHEIPARRPAEDPASWRHRAGSVALWLFGVVVLLALLAAAFLLGHRAGARAARPDSAPTTAVDAPGERFAGPR